MYTQVWGSGLQGEEAGLSLGPPNSDLQVEGVCACVRVLACVVMGGDVGLRAGFSTRCSSVPLLSRTHALDPS